jgi:hypothetical protein
VSRANLRVVESGEQPRPTGPVRLRNAKEMATIFGVSEREWYRIGALVPHYRIGRMVRWDADEAVAALREEPER